MKYLLEAVKNRINKAEIQSVDREDKLQGLYKLR